MAYLSDLRNQVKQLEEGVGNTALLAVMTDQVALMEQVGRVAREVDSLRVMVDDLKGPSNA